MKIASVEEILEVAASCGREVVNVADREQNQRRSPAGCDFGVIARASNIDMCVKSEGNFDEKKPCKTDKECQSHCVIGFGKCDLGRCWCILPPSSADSIPTIIAPN
ncbi:hypothetical protein RYX36_007583 [Vicia faba]